MSIHYDKHYAITKMQNNIKMMIELGGRGLGKTHSWAIYCSEREGKTIWIRRKSDELRRCVSTFLDYLVRDGKTEIGKIQQKIIEIDDKGRKITVDCYADKDGNEKIVFLPLSVAHKMKSSELGSYDMAVFDEFTSITGDYLKNEDILLMEMLSTQMRLRNFKLILIGNNCDPFNPIFNFFNIHVNYEKEFSPIYNGDGVKIGYVHMINASKDFIEQYKKSTIGLLTSGTKYDDYALGNRSFHGFDIPIEPNESNMTQELHLLYQDKHIFIQQGKSGKYHLTEKGDKTTLAYTNDVRQVNPNKKIVFSDEIMYMLRPMIKQGLIVSESELILSRLYDWLGII